MTSFDHENWHTAGLDAHDCACVGDFSIFQSTNRMGVFKSYCVFCFFLSDDNDGGENVNELPTLSSEAL